MKNNHEDKARIEVTPTPATPREELVESLHGQPVADPFRWLEDNGSEQVKEWDRLQNQRTRRVLDAISGREAFQQRLEGLLAIPGKGAPEKCGQRYFFMQRTSDENQPRLYVAEGKGEPRVIIDPNKLSDEGVVSLDWYYPSPDGELLAYGLSQHGSEQSTLHVLNVTTGEALSEAIPRTTHASVAWLPDNRGFYYTRYPFPGEVPPEEEHYHCRLFVHILGEDHKRDPLVFGAELPIQDIPFCLTSKCGRFLIVGVQQTGTYTTELLVKNLDENSSLTPLIHGLDGWFYPSFSQHRLFLFTNYQAPNARVLMMDLDHFSANAWQEIIPESKAVLTQASVAGDRLVLSYLKNAYSELRIASLQGDEIKSLPLPGLGSIGMIIGKEDETEIFYGFDSFTIPPTIYRYDLAEGKTEIYYRKAVPFDADKYEMKQVWYPSRDGTNISMYLCHRKNVQLDGSNPTVLSGYGGFNVNITSYFSYFVMLWMEKGGVYAIPNLRGGGEYGEEWHRAGMLGNKQKVFDDFIAAAEWLIAQGYTKPEKLVISGGSNGGLLVSAAMVQRPDLYKAVVCAVPVIDMLRYHRFLIAKLWMGEYGDPENPEHFRWLYNYSPYHHVEEGVQYPPALIVTAESDGRVDPMHARKFAARVQEVMGASAPILYWIEDKAGHGMGTPLPKQAREMTDTFSFISWQLGIPL